MKGRLAAFILLALVGLAVVAANGASTPMLVEARVSVDRHHAAIHVAGHNCRVPTAAYSTLNGSGVAGSVPAEFPEKDLRAMERFGFCLCGPEGTVDWDPRPHKRGGFFMHPSCNRDGWDGRHYRKES